MENNDTTKLLRECDAGAKMAVTSIDEILEHVRNQTLKDLLKESKQHHEDLGNKIHEQINLHHCEEKEPGLMAKGMSWMKTNMKISMDSRDSMIADLLTDGCDMGIKSLYGYLHEYHQADEEAKKLCNKLIAIEEELRKELQQYL